MIRCEQNDWAGLEQFARAHLATFPNDVQARLALGLALHRQGKSRDAASVFDSAFAKMPYSDARRLDRPGRVSTPSRASRTDLNWAGAREAFSRVFWGMADPSWADGITERQVEFRARVAYAEFRWTVAELEIPGAETERGDVYIRYGPPEMVAVFGPNASESAGDIMTFWIYRSGMIFAFSSMSGFGTARIPQSDMAMIEGYKDAQPARWDNLPAPKIDSIITRFARFRANRDSLELVVASLVPATVVTGDAPTARLWLLPSTGVGLTRDSSAIGAGGLATWVSGYDVAYEQVLRVEASAPAANRLARFQTHIPRDSTMYGEGPGISDVLVASSVGDVNAPLARWRDAKPVPSVGAIDRGRNVWLVWENYELAAVNGSAQYDVTISVKRIRAGAGRIVANVIGALAAIARVTSGDDQAEVQYTRTAPQSKVVVEAMALDLGATPAGEYDVTVRVTDKTAGRTMARTVRITVRE
jgi:GWxTD domain-containing protein